MEEVGARQDAVHEVGGTAMGTWAFVAREVVRHFNRFPTVLPSVQRADGANRQLTSLHRRPPMGLP